MDRLTIQENPDGVASRDVRNEQRPCDANNTSTMSREQSNDLHKISNSIDCETKIVNPSLRRFLLSLNAKEVAGPRGCRTFTLQPGAYAKTLESLRKSNSEVWGYVSDELRHDLINDEYLVIKMPGTIHEFVAEMISDSIKTQLVAIKQTSNESTRRLIQSIHSLCSRQIKLYGSDERREPDRQYLIEGSYYPGIILELAYSQSFQSLRCKAQDLIVDSDGKIQLVIGLEIENKKSCKISAWRADFIRSKDGDTVRMKTVIEQDIVRDGNGKLKSGIMTFQLQDFGSNLKTTYPDADLTKPIVLDYNHLAGYLAKAEELDIQRPLGPNMRGWKEPAQEAEELTPEDEKKFRELEEISSARSGALDSDYR